MRPCIKRFGVLVVHVLLPGLLLIPLLPVTYQTAVVRADRTAYGLGRGVVPVRPFRPDGVVVPPTAVIDRSVGRSVTGKGSPQRTTGMSERMSAASSSACRQVRVGAGDGRKGRRLKIALARSLARAMRLQATNAARD